MCARAPAIHGALACYYSNTAFKPDLGAASLKWNGIGDPVELGERFRMIRPYFSLPWEPTEPNFQSLRVKA